LEVYPILAAVPKILEQLEQFYLKQEPGWPTDPYLFLVWWYCGYPASDAACERGWNSLDENIGVRPEQLLAAPVGMLARALAPGGMMPERRATRLKELADRVQTEFGGDLRGRLFGSPQAARKVLKTFPSIAEPGADRILLFAGIAPIAAVPSNCVHVLVRILRGVEREDYRANYRDAQRAIEAEVPANFEARQRAYLLLKKHGQEICKYARPKCDQCPVASSCSFTHGTNPRNISV
jgi:endonuclease-3